MSSPAFTVRQRCSMLPSIISIRNPEDIWHLLCAPRLRVIDERNDRKTTLFSASFLGTLSLQWSWVPLRWGCDALASGAEPPLGAFHKYFG
jgi:hypothetical protein